MIQREERLIRHAEAQRKLVRKRLRKGLCVYCGDEAATRETRPNKFGVFAVVRMRYCDKHGIQRRLNQRYHRKYNPWVRGGRGTAPIYGGFEGDWA